MAFGIDSTGFGLKRLEDIKAEIKEVIELTFGATANTDERAPLGQLMGIFAEREALLWELFEDLYNSFSPSTAEGAALDNVVALTGTVRKGATKSTGTATLFGTVATLIPAGSIASVSGNTAAKFVTNVDATVAAGIDEIQTLAFSQVPDGGSFTLNFDGEITGSLDETTTAASLETALEALVNITSVTVTGSYGAGFTITFDGANGSKPQNILLVGSNALTAFEVSSVDTLADTAGSLDGTYFIIYDSLGSVGVWFDLDDNGTSVPGGAAAADRAIEVTAANTNDTDAQVATAIKAALDTDGSFTTAISTNELTITDTVTGSRTDVADGNSGFTFAVDTQGQDATGITITPAESVSGALPQIDVAVTAQTAGATAAPSSSLTVIESPVTGWDSITNALDITIGTDIETDTELRLRRIRELAIAGRATVNAIIAKIIEIDAVTDIIVFENDTNIENSDGVPPNSVEAVIVGGVDADIAQALFDVVAAGVGTFGSTTESVDDSQGFPHDIKFSRPSNVQVYVDIEVVDDPNTFPVNGADLIEAAIIETGNNFGIGTDVIVIPKLLCAIAEVDGVLSATIKVGTNAIPATSSATFLPVIDGTELKLNAVAHGYAVGDRLKFATAGTLPTGLNLTDVFTVVDVVDANSYKVGVDRTSTSILYTDAGTGVHTSILSGYDANLAIETHEISAFDTSRTSVTVL